MKTTQEQMGVEEQVETSDSTKQTISKLEAHAWAWPGSCRLAQAGAFLRPLGAYRFVSPGGKVGGAPDDFAGKLGSVNNAFRNILRVNPWNLSTTCLFTGDKAIL